MKIGQYKVTRKIASGGCADVYQARDETGRQVAVKVHRAGFERRVQFEADVMSRLRHEHVVQVSGYGRDGNTQRLYLVMEYVPYPTLREVLSERGHLPFALAVEILDRIAATLDYVYANSEVVAHRDIKPGNIFVDISGDCLNGLKLTDFGICRVDEGMGTMGGALWDANYAAPEQVKGDKQAFGPATDIYALGCLAYRMLGGRNVFQGDQHARAEAHLQAEPVSLKRWAPEIPASVAAWVHQCLKKRPQDRYSDMRVFRAALADACGEQAVDAVGDDVPSSSELKAGRFGCLPLALVLFGLGGVACSMLAGGGFAAWGLMSDEPVLLWAGMGIGLLGLLVSVGFVLLGFFLWLWRDGDEDPEAMSPDIDSFEIP